MTARDRPLWTTRIARRAVCAYIPDFPAGTPVHRFPSWWVGEAKSAYRRGAQADLAQGRMRATSRPFLEQWRADNLLKPRQPRSAPAHDRRSPKRPGRRRAR
jgi:hypothetical protein